jgi:hypothetical protein
VQHAFGVAGAVDDQFELGNWNIGGGDIDGKNGCGEGGETYIHGSSAYATAGDNSNRPLGHGGQ